MSKKQITKESAELLAGLQNINDVAETIDGKPFPIPKSGSLGLLALGYRGLVAWRKVRKSK